MRRALATLAFVLAACAPSSRLAAPPEPPRVDEPQLAMPGDLDLVVRVDLELLRGVLGEDVQAAIERVLATAPAGDPDAATSRLLLSLFARAKTAWIGVRPGLSPALTDNVLVLRGNFDGLLLKEPNGAPRWSSGRDLGGGVFRFERAAPRLRGSPAVLYWRAPDLVVVGSFAEIDALERTLELGRGDPPLEPPDTGLISAAARLDVLQQRLQASAPTFSKLAEGAEKLSGSAAWTGSELDVRIELTFDSPDRAGVVAEALAAIARVLATRERSWLGAASVTSVERFVTVRVRVPADALARELRDLPVGVPGRASPSVPAEPARTDQPGPAPSGTVRPP